ncbi:cobaltochelatase subunit CobN [Halorarum halobium]|uniref:cobaltochelatase subunit CobN n=1 Tax=Halorarum halobium TaxID=3075121 RepID=UPI0028B1647F|nr:cobaltochelatase subunit CobN [Halobaculum sp. XH14]
MILFITSVDTELLTAQQALERLPSDFPPVRMAGTDHLQSRAELEAFLDDLGTEPGAIVVRVLGGKQYFETGLDVLSELARDRNVPLLVLPGTREMDPELTALSTATPAETGTVFEYFSHGGVPNFENLFRYLAARYLVADYEYDDPEELPWHGLYHPDLDDATRDLDAFRNRTFGSDRPVMAILFYRANWISGNLDAVDALIERARAEGYDPLPIFCYSMRNRDDSASASAPAVVDEYLTDDEGTVPDVILTTLSYHMGSLRRNERGTTKDAGSNDFLADLDVPVVQGMNSSETVEEWEANEEGLPPRDTANKVAMPEFDGRITGNASSFREPVELDDAVTGPVYRQHPVPDRTGSTVDVADRYARLGRLDNEEKKVAVLLTNFPTSNARVGNAVGLDTPASVINVLERLRDAGYRTGEIPEDGDALMETLIDRGGYDEQFLTREQMREAPGRIHEDEYGEWFETFPDEVRAEMRDEWDDPPGDVYRDDEHVYLAGVRFENVFVGIQPPRGFGENPIAVYHSPDLVPTHHYAGFYRWLSNGFGADAIVHAGKHGTLEWLPGKAVALSESCYPEVANPDLPVFYPFIMNDPGEGSQAKRRLHSTVIDHLVPPMTTADTYGDLDHLQTLLDEYQQAEEMDPKKLPQIRNEIWELVLENDLDEDLQVNEQPDDFGAFTEEIDGYLCEIGALQIRGGLHVLGEPPTDEKLVHFLTSLLRLDTEHVQGIRRAIADEYGIDYDAVTADPGKPYDGSRPAFLAHVDADGVRTRGDVEEAIESFARALVSPLVEGRSAADARETFGIDADSPIQDVLTYVEDDLLPAIRRTTDETDNLLRGLDGDFVPPGPSGAPTRGMPELLPTGRNFYSVDIRAVPSPYAWEVGTDLADSLLATHREDEGEYPESIGIVVWGTSNMRTKGDDVAEILSLLGVEPVWNDENRRVEGLNVIPLEELGRPRIDVTVRISGFFRDAFPHVVDLLDEAVNTVADLDEPPERNYVRKHAERDRTNYEAEGMDPEEAERRSRYRVFGSKPGTYGAGILPAINQRNWETDEDLAGVYLNWGGYAYTDDEYGSEAIDVFKERLSNVQVAVQNQDNREHDVFDSDDYLQFHGGMVATVRALTGENPSAMFGDSSEPEDVEVRHLDDEARRVFRSRVVNPKWVESMHEHGYKGALEMAATVDFLFGYDATAEVVDDWMYADVSETYLLDEENREFLEEHNPWAIRSMSERLLEAMDRDMWAEPDEELRAKLERLYLENEGMLEGRGE